MIVMAPTIDRIDRDALQPYAAGRLSQRVAIERGAAPIRDFMLRQVKRRDLEVFARLAHRPSGEDLMLAPPTVLIPAFVVGELRNAFAIGVALYLPFVAIDLAVAGILMALGMFMLSPPVVSLPAKLALFVLVDGWALVSNGVVSSFR
jgi:flagellar biosynthetic protein FliP